MHVPMHSAVYLLHFDVLCDILSINSSSAKIVIHLHPVPATKEPGPYQNSKFSYIKLSFKEHGQIEVCD